jgi:hypothetical protein
VSVLIQGSQSRSPLLGIRVEKAAFTLPATASTEMFTVSGGRVVVTSLFGEVTTVVQSQACNLNVTIDPTGAGAAADLVAATEINGDAVGTFYSVSGIQAALLGTQKEGGTEVPTHALAKMPVGGGFLVPAGSIYLKTSATNTGATKWVMTYIPLDDGASVVAA